MRKREPVYQALWAAPEDFDEVLISPVMIQDHMPDNMLKALNKVSSQLVEKIEGVMANRQPVRRSSSVKPGVYEPLEESADIHEIDNAEIEATQTMSVMNRDVRSINCSNDAINSIESNGISIVVDVEIHERNSI